MRKKTVLKSAEKPYKKIETRNHELETLIKELEKANNAKSEFLAKMSCEMRTPLNAVIGLSKIMLNISNLDKPAKDNLEKIHNSGLTLLNIVNDVLDISEIQSGSLTINPVKYDVPGLINDAVLQNVLRIESGPIKFILNVDENIPAQLIGDELRVKQIINNLLSNAVKYTEEGEITLGITGERDGDNVWLTVSVRDTGIGIRPEDVELLFNGYAQFGAAAKHRRGGTGLGLSITKSLAELMGGKISVESKYGEGSIFTVKILQQCAGEKIIGYETVKNLKSFQYNAVKYEKEETQTASVSAEDAGSCLVSFNKYISGINLSAGLKMYADEKSYIQILRSFAANIDTMLDSVDEVNRKKLASYSVAVHGIKGAARNVCAAQLADQAEDLENAAKSGNWDFVFKNNQLLIGSVLKLVFEINTVLEKYSAANPKPKKEYPDKHSLTMLREACAGHDFTKIDEIMDGIEQYEYTEDDGLAVWLRESIFKMNLEQVINRLENRDAILAEP